MFLQPQVVDLVLERRDFLLGGQAFLLDPGEILRDTFQRFAPRRQFAFAAGTQSQRTLQSRQQCCFNQSGNIRFDRTATLIEFVATTRQALGRRLQRLYFFATRALEEFRLLQRALGGPHRFTTLIQRGFRAAQRGLALLQLALLRRELRFMLR